MGPDEDALFGEIAIEKGLVSSEQVDECLENQKTVTAMGMEQSLGDIVVSKKYITREQQRDVMREVMKRVGRHAKIGAYEVLEKLGQGGMGAVYKARVAETGAVVAIKVLPPEFAKNKGFVERFRREAKVASELDHPNIVRALSAGESGGYHYFAMEYVEGDSVGSHLKNEGRFEEPEALEVIRQVTLGLQHAHEAGLVHRDIKPDNIFLTSDGEAKLGDLGLAREAGEDASQLTQAGVMVGTPHYVSPEQARGDKDIDIRTDLYSLGATLHHMVTGVVPFDGDTAMAVMNKHTSEDLAWPGQINSDLSDGICQLITNMMAKSRDDRYQTPAELLDDIDLVIDGEMPKLEILTIGSATVAPPLVDIPRGIRADDTRATAVSPAFPGPVPEIMGRRAGGTTVGTVMAAVPGRRGRLPVIVGSAAAAVVVVIAAVVLTRTPEKPSAVVDGPPGQGVEEAPILAPEKEDTVLTEERIRERYRHAERYWQQNPHRPDRAIAKFREIQQKARGTAWSLKAREAIADIEESKKVLARRPTRRPPTQPARPQPTLPVRPEPPQPPPPRQEPQHRPQFEPQPRPAEPAPARPLQPPQPPQLPQPRVPASTGFQYLWREGFDGTSFAQGWSGLPERGTTLKRSRGARAAMAFPDNQYDAFKMEFAAYRISTSKRPFAGELKIFEVADDVYVSFWYHLTGGDKVNIYGRNERIKRNMTHHIERAVQNRWTFVAIKTTEFSLPWVGGEKAQKGDAFSQLLFGTGNPGRTGIKLVLDDFAITKGAPPQQAPAPAVAQGPAQPQPAPFVAAPPPEEDAAVVAARSKKISAAKRLDEVLDQFEAMVTGGKLEKAKEGLAEAKKDGALAGFGAELGAAGRILDELAAAEKSGLAALKKAIGKKVKVSLRGTTKIYTIKAVEGEEIEVERELRLGGRRTKMSLKVKLENLAPGELDRLASYTPTTPDGHIASAIRAIAGKGFAEARRSVALAGDHPLAGRCIERIENATFSPEEIAARDSWVGTIVIRSGEELNLAGAKALLHEVKSFRAQHGKTKYAAGRSAELAALEKKAQDYVDSRITRIDLGAAKVLWRENFDSRVQPAGWSGQVEKVTTCNFSAGALMTKPEFSSYRRSCKLEFGYYLLPVDRRSGDNSLYHADDDVYISFFYYLRGESRITICAKNSTQNTEMYHYIQNARQNCWVPVVLKAMDFPNSLRGGVSMRKGDRISSFSLWAGQMRAQGVSIVIDEFAVTKGPPPRIKGPTSRK